MARLKELNTKRRILTQTASIDSNNARTMSLTSKSLASTTALLNGYAALIKESTFENRKKRSYDRKEPQEQLYTNKHPKLNHQSTRSIVGTATIDRNRGTYNPLHNADNSKEVALLLNGDTSSGGDSAMGNTNEKTSATNTKGNAYETMTARDDDDEVVCGVCFKSIDIWGKSKCIICSMCLTKVSHAASVSLLISD